MSEKFEKKGLEGSLFHEDKKLFGTFRRPRSLYEVYRDHGEDSQIYKVAKRNMWASLGMNAAVLSVISPLVENWLTRKHALAEQQKLVAKPTAPVLPPLVTSSPQPSVVSASPPIPGVNEINTAPVAPPPSLPPYLQVVKPLQAIPQPIPKPTSLGLPSNQFLNPPAHLDPSDEVGPISPRL